MSFPNTTTLKEKWKYLSVPLGLHEGTEISTQLVKQSIAPDCTYLVFINPYNDSDGCEWFPLFSKLPPSSV